jgi:hypothetical protein
MLNDSQYYLDQIAMARDEADQAKAQWESTLEQTIEVNEGKLEPGKAAIGRNLSDIRKSILEAGK